MPKLCCNCEPIKPNVPKSGPWFDTVGLVIFMTLAYIVFALAVISYFTMR